ncbi:MAG: PIN domain-containing protein [Opitutaceae bacterium]
MNGCIPTHLRRAARGSRTSGTSTPTLASPVNPHPGSACLHRAKDAKAAGALERWLLGLESHYAERVLPITPSVADRWGRLSPAQPLPVSDGLIAATVIEHKLAVVTRNVADLQRAGVNTLNPFV